MKQKRNRQERKKLGIAICAILIVITLLVGVFYPAFATLSSAATKSELEKEVATAQKNKNDAKKLLDQVKANRTNVSNEVLAIDDEINRAENELVSTENAIETAKANLAVKEQELIVAEKNCLDYDEDFKTRARIMYENGTTSYIEVLLGASSFGDFLSRVELIREIIEYDKKMLAEMIASRNAISEAKEAIAQEKLTLEAKQTELEEMRSELQYRLEAKELLLAQLHADEEEYKKAYEKAEADEKKVQKELQKILEKEKKNGTATVYKGTGRFVWPVPASRRVTSKYGYRIHPVYKTKKFHAGIDIGAGYGCDILAAESGTVTLARYGSGYGKYVIINHGSGITTLYGHCSSLLVNVGDKVERGEVIAKVGSTGVSTGNHLHFEVRINGQTTDPLTYVN